MVVAKTLWLPAATTYTCETKERQYKIPFLFPVGDYTLVGIFFAIMRGVIKNALGHSAEVGNLIYYLCGSNLRVVEQVVSTMKEEAVRSGSNITKETLRSLSKRFENGWDPRTTEGPLIEALLSPMIHKKNRDIVRNAAHNPASTQTGRLPFKR